MNSSDLVHWLDEATPKQTLRAMLFNAIKHKEHVAPLQATVCMFL